LYQKPKASLHYKKRKYFSIGIGTKTRANKYTIKLKTKSTMKKIILLTTLAFVCMAVACVKNPPTPNCGQLPCPSATGANVVSCYVNGEPYIAKGGKPDLTSTMGGCKQGSFLQPKNGLSTSHFDFRFCNNNYPENIYIYIYENLEVKNYSLSNINKVVIDGTLLQGQTDELNTGSLQITNMTEKIISGTFEFTVEVNKLTHEKLHFTNGTFDLAR
jgi:hypothetical protein